MSDRQSEAVGITLPRSLLEQIDTYRGDVPRSRFIARIVERSFEQVPQKEPEMAA